MKRWLRIAVSVFFAVVAVAFAAWWVRSGWWHDTIVRCHRGDWYGIDSAQGVLIPNVMPGIGVGDGWIRSSTPLEDAEFHFVSIGGVGRFGIPLSTIYFSHWIPALIAATLAVVPWLPRRFSLRTLLIATTLIAVVLGLIVAAS